MEDPSEIDTDDMPGPPPNKPRLVRELERGLGRGQEFYDETGRRLVTVDEILEQLRRTGKVYGPKVPTRRADDDFDPEHTAQVDLKERSRGPR